MAAAREGSGVRARWVELPDCFEKWCNFIDSSTGKPWATAVSGQPTTVYEPLRDDLANAAIASCKGAKPAGGENEAGCSRTLATTDDSSSSGDSSGTWTASAPSTIYDPVWKTATVIPNHEHQVQGAGVHAISAGKEHQVAILNQTQQVDGPKGDF